MACFTACVAEALVAYGIKKTLDISTNHKYRDLSRKLSLLIKMLLGGSFLLAVEHIFHGEIIFSYPFLTAMQDPEDTKVMVNEILTVGIAMDIAVTSVWAFTAYVLPFVKHAKKETV